MYCAALWLHTHFFTLFLKFRVFKNSQSIFFWYTRCPPVSLAAFFNTHLFGGVYLLMTWISCCCYTQTLCAPAQNYIAYFISMSLLKFTWRNHSLCDWLAICPGCIPTLSSRPVTAGMLGCVHINMIFVRLPLILTHLICFLPLGVSSVSSVRASATNAGMLESTMLNFSTWWSHWFGNANFRDPHQKEWKQ